MKQMPAKLETQFALSALPPAMRAIRKLSRNGLMGKLAKWIGITQPLFVLEQGGPFRVAIILNGAKAVMPANGRERRPAWPWL